MSTTPQRTGEDDARLDALRQRLYRAGATEDDVQRYVAEQQERVLEQPEPPPAPRPPRRSWRRAAAGSGIALVAALALIAVVQRDPTPISAAPTATVASSSAVVQDVGEGEVLAIDRGTASGPTAVATSIRGVAVVGQRFMGRGNAVVPFDPPIGSLQGGRAQVTLVARGPAPVHWRALLRVDRNDWSSYPVVLARGVADGRVGPAAPVTFVYPTRPPTKVAVAAPDDVPWTLEIAVTNGLEPQLR